MIPIEIKDFLKANGFKILIVSISAFVALFSLIWMPANNSLEVAAEKEIELLTGFNIDFTPDGPSGIPPVGTPKGMNGPAQPR